MKRNGVGITIMSAETMEAVFDLLLYGVTMSQICSIPMAEKNMSDEEMAEMAASVGGGLVRAALRRRGLDPDDFIATPFDSYEL